LELVRPDGYVAYSTPHGSNAELASVRALLQAQTGTGMPVARDRTAAA
jgi:hypothetical protein